jgi:hypothetical protein
MFHLAFNLSRQNRSRALDLSYLTIDIRTPITNSNSDSFLTVSAVRTAPSLGTDEQSAVFSGSSWLQSLVPSEMGKYVSTLQKALAKMTTGDQKLLLHMAQKVAKRK